MSMSTMLDIEQFATKHRVSTKTVRRWLDAGRIVGAVKVGGKWAIPANAAIQATLPGVMAAVKDTSQAPVHPWAPSQAIVPVAATPIVPNVTVADQLACIPVMVPVDLAARILGLSERVIRRNPEYFHLVRFGGQGGAYVMPKARIRELEG